MTTIKTNYRSMTDAELIDEGMDCEQDSLAYALASTLNTIPIYKGSLSVSESSRKDCDKLQSKIDDLQQEVARLENDLENLDIERLVLGAKRAREAVKKAHDKINYLFDLGDSND